MVDAIEKSCLECSGTFLIHGREIKRGFLRADGIYIHKQNSQWCNRKCFLTWRNREENPSKTPQARKKISDGLKKRGYAQLHTPEAREKQRKTISGSGHWNWQGGKTPENKRRRVNVDYKRWRIAIFERDNYTCVLCGVRGTELQADHIKPWSLYPELRLELSNGRTLCVRCHKDTDTYMGRARWGAKP